MNNPAIKICGVRSPELAYQTALAGAHFIGIIFHPQSKRHAGIELAKAVATAAKTGGAIPVAVFVEQTAAQMQEICLAADIQTVQLHGSMARQQHHRLPLNYRRLYAQSVSPTGAVADDEDGGLAYCDPERDFLLFDNAQPGKGKIFNWDQFNYHGHFRMGLAGGLTPDNVTVAIKKFQPAIVDVSGGVENILGEKDLLLIKKFINAVQSITQQVGNFHE